MVLILPKINIPIINGLILALGGMNTAFGLIFTSFTLSTITFEYQLTKIQQTMFNVSAYISAVFGTLLINIFVSKYGKSICCFLSSIFCILSWIGLGISNSKFELFLFRSLIGFCMGIFSSIIPTFIHEIAPSDKKFLYGFLNQIEVSIGFLCGTILGSRYHWRIVSFVSCIPSIVLMIFIMFIPEPPISLIQVSMKHVLGFRKQLLIAFCLMFFLQFSGINAVLSNLQDIVKNANLTFETNIVAISAGVTQLCSTLIASFVVDILGNRVCWVVSALGQMIAFFFLFIHHQYALQSIFFLLGLYLEQFMYGIGNGPIPFVASASLFRTEMRSSAMAVTTAEGWSLTAVVCFLFPYLESKIGIGLSFLFFCFVQVLSVLFGLWVFPNSSDDDDSSTDDEETENISQRISHAQDLSEL